MNTAAESHGLFPAFSHILGESKKYAVGFTVGTVQGIYFTVMYFILKLILNGQGIYREEFYGPAVIPRAVENSFAVKTQSRPVNVPVFAFKICAVTYLLAFFVFVITVAVIF